VTNTTEGQVRRIDGRLYVTMGGVEHGLDDDAAAALMWSLARDLYPGETLAIGGDRKP
jgi:hypothetical protein